MLLLKGNAVSDRTQADKIIRDHVVWSMGAGLIPVPLADIAAVSAVQLDMLSKLATEYQVRFSILDAKARGYEGDSCVECGAMTMVRNGSCLKCVSCGSTSGCS